MSEPKTMPIGIPIYQDSDGRSITDPTEEVDPTNWEPRNQLAAKLWRCLESLRDIRDLLEDTSKVSNPKKQRRRLKILATPILTLAQSTESLCNTLATDPALTNNLSKKQRNQFSKLRENLLVLVPLGADSPLKVVRNKMSAHVDAKLGPRDARDILGKAKPNTYGIWLHSCIYVLQELMQPDLYSWQTADGPEGSIRIMNAEPMVITLIKDSDGELILGSVNVGISPKRFIHETIKDVVRDSQWLFGEKEARLKVLEDA